MNRVKKGVLLCLFSFLRRFGVYWLQFGGVRVTFGLRSVRIFVWFWSILTFILKRVVEGVFAKKSTRSTFPPFSPCIFLAYLG